MKQVRTSTIIAIFLITCAALVVAGCAGSNTGSANPTATPTAGTTALSMPIEVFGNVSNPMNLTVSDLRQYPQISIKGHVYGAHQHIYVMSATGASLNAILNATQPDPNAELVVFTGTDGFSSSVPLSAIRSDNQSIIVSSWVTNDTTSGAGDTNSFRDIIPSQYFATSWVYDLDSIQVV